MVSGSVEVLFGPSCFWNNTCLLEGWQQHNSLLLRCSRKSSYHSLFGLRGNNSPARNKGACLRSFTLQYPSVPQRQPPLRFGPGNTPKSHPRFLFAFPKMGRVCIYINALLVWPQQKNMPTHLSQKKSADKCSCSQVCVILGQFWKLWPFGCIRCKINRDTKMRTHPVWPGHQVTHTRSSVFSRAAQRLQASERRT